MGPVWRDPRRNSANFPAWIVQSGWMATQLVTKRCDLGSLRVPGPASTPFESRDRGWGKWGQPPQGRQDKPRPDQAKARHNKQAKSRLPAGSLQGPGPKGVLAGPGTPRDPKSHLFVTKWVAIQPFWTILTGIDAEFQPGGRQIGPTPSISTFF